MKALITALALLSFVGASAVPTVAHAADTMTHHQTTKKATHSKKKHTAKKSMKHKTAKKSTHKKKTPAG